MNSKQMIQSSSFVGYKEYMPPLVVVLHLEFSKCLLVASNEGLEYEDLFAPQQHLFDEDPFLL